MIVNTKRAITQPSTVVTKNSAATPPAVDVDRLRNATDLLTERNLVAPDHIAFEVRQPGTRIDHPWTQVSTSEFAREIQRLAKGLLASGVQPGETVLIMAPTQYLWAVVDQAALFAGALVVPVYNTAPVGQLASIVTDSKPVAAFVDTQVHRELLINAAHAAGIAVPNIWLLETGHSSSLSNLTELGHSVSDLELEARRTLASLDDVATIVYTSGTTGTPKGARITHRNLVGQVLNTAAAYEEVVNEQGNTVLFLPLTHVLGRALQLICIANGMRVAHLSDPKEAVQALSVLQPTFLVVVPRVLEKIESAAADSARKKHLLPLWLRARRTAIEWAQHSEAGTVPPFTLRLQHKIFDRLFYSRLRAVMGGRMKFLLSGAAALRPELAHLFTGIGVPVIEGYGLTETTAPLTGTRPGALTAGSVGTPLPGNEVRIAPNGEVLARGIGVFPGYRDSGDTAAAFVDGYFRTGDLGELDETGALKLTGRLKHVIVTSTGRTISPEGWEQVVELHPLVAHAALIGNDRPYLTALVVIDPEAARTWLQERSKVPPEALDAPNFAAIVDEHLCHEITSAVAHANSTVLPSTQAQKWSIVTLGHGQPELFVTPTMKLKRQALLDAGTSLIASLYATESTS
ncbi:AMP-dependent synthetase/ligase [Leucobacter sp. CX42]|uniref:AMP-dependent synthetase/ligase n=1 Tax=unclassified Leucobacter TaxID=2621730 RepID=UPI00333F023C